MPRRMRPSTRTHALLRFLLFGIALPCVYFGGAGAAFYFRQRQANQSQDLLRLPHEAPPTAHTRLMVFAPHCDDETLGCAGRIQQTMEAGGAVRAVILTNGDGYPAAVARQMRVLHAGPKDFIQFAALRQHESTQALQSLGVSADSTLFLGYPDGGLLTLWNEDWTPDSPYTSSFTECNRSPYALTYHKASQYCGHDLLADILCAMKEFHPTVVAVTHPAEDHPDHAAAAAFVTLALQELRNDPKEAHWAAHTRLCYYLIHRGDWPMPQGAHPDAPLLPPLAMAHTDTDWTLLPLTPAQTQRKAASINDYPSQTTLMGGFLSAFARRNELYGTIPIHTLPVLPMSARSSNGTTTDWTTLSPILLDPARDNMLRDLQGGADILALYCARTSDRLDLRLVTRRPVSRRFTYTVHIRAFGPNGESPTAALKVELLPGSPDTQAGGVYTRSEDRTLDASVPWSMVADGLDSNTIQMLTVSAETALSTLEIDKTGVRFLTVTDAPKLTGTPNPDSSRTIDTLQTRETEPSSSASHITGRQP